MGGVGLALIGPMCVSDQLITHSNPRIHTHTQIEATLPRANVLYVRYEDLKNPDKRVHALSKVAQFLGQPASARKVCVCVCL